MVSAKGQRQIELHRHLDEIAAEFSIATGKLWKEATIQELLEWSQQRLDKLKKRRGNGD